MPPCPPASFGTRALSARAALVLAIALAGLPGCGLFLPSGEDCPDLDEVCPDVVCDDYKQNREGCSICECEGDEPPVGNVCWDEADCADGQRCDVVNFCEPAPNCSEGDEPCPDACYGRCIDAPSACSSDEDCPAGQLCNFFANERPEEERPDSGGDDGAPPPDGDPGQQPEPAPPPQTGVCQDVSCGQADVALPECPPGSELVFKDDACGPICQPVDFCRELLPEECLSQPGCELVEEGCGCGTGEENCDCASIERCIAVDDCSALPLEECELNPSCVLKAIGNGDAPGGGGEAPCECAPDDPDCGCGSDPIAPPPPEELVCVPRGSDGTCLSDADCFAGEICELTTVCGSGCNVDAEGNEECFDECWSERGVCIASDRTCFDLLPDECAADPRCELVEDGGAAPCFCDPADPDCPGCESSPGSFCQPRDGSCASDADCSEGQHCQVTQSCPACDPSSGDDIDCLAPCFSEGSCVDGDPPPTPCNSDADCGDGACVAFTVCEACSSGGNGAGEAPEPAPCDPVCREENLCVETVATCATDADCGADETCTSTCGNGLVAPPPGEECPSVCVAQEQVCQEDSQCDAGERCATELDHCLDNPDAPGTGCWTVCVDDETVTEGAYCLDDDACAEGTCRFQDDVCLDDPNSDLALCSGYCVSACAEVETLARDPNGDGACFTFPDSCIPPGWERCEAP